MKCEADTMTANCDKNNAPPGNCYRRRAAANATTAKQYYRWADAVAKARAALKKGKAR